MTSTDPVHWVVYLTADKEYVIATDYQAAVVGRFRHKKNANRWAKKLNKAYMQGRADGRDDALTPELQELIADGKAWQCRIGYMAGQQ